MTTTRTRTRRTIKTTLPKTKEDDADALDARSYANSNDDDSTDKDEDEDDGEAACDDDDATTTAMMTTARRTTAATTQRLPTLRNPTTTHRMTVTLPKPQMRT